jgi:putative aminopeptidase FrvX
MITRARWLALCRSVLEQPAVSFHEHAVARCLAAHAAGCGLPSARDRWGNLHVRYGPAGGRPAWVLLAHMDHPGFVIASARGDTARARWFGRVERRYFAGARVRVFGAGARGVPGEVLGTRVGGTPRRVTELRLRMAAPVSPGHLGMWDLPVMRVREGRIATRAADDLIGCAVLAGLLETLAAQRPRTRVTVVYTRAEEAGLLGATALARDRIVPRDCPVLSLETSREHSGADLGKGVVLRLGDRVSAFDAPMQGYLATVAREIARTSRAFAWQRALMDGGTCEATPLAAYGYRSGGLAIPLRNYHNMGRSRIAPEIVALADVESALGLLLAIVRTPPPRVWPLPAPRAAFDARLRPAARELRHSALGPVPERPRP